MDKPRNGAAKPRNYCPVCQGSGFNKPGQICPCITSKGIDLPEGWSDIFGDIIKGGNDDTKRR